MTAAEGPFEVEFRCRFDNPEAAAQVVPFLPSILGSPVPWHGTLYGLELFRSGQILRTGRTIEDGEFHDYLTWKGPDIGGFCNIRQEIGEEITAGLSDGIVDMDDAAEELQRLGYLPFMSWQGIDRYGYYQPADIRVKLMNCEALKWPWILEFEKIADTEAEAVKCENKLYEFSQNLRLFDYILKEEPTQLLYQKYFPQ